jgi:hypothetical protein
MTPDDTVQDDNLDERHPNDDYDNPWKAAIEHYFRPFMELLFPAIASQIAWEKEYTFMDKELQKITRDAQVGKLFADKLVRVYRRDGSELYVMIHVEVQNQEQAQFGNRMLVYNCRLSDQYKVPIVSLAVLGDESQHWRPNSVTRELWGCKHTFTFPIVKLADYRERWDELEASTNPFAVVIMAHLKTQETRHDYGERRRWKVAIARQLYQKGYTEDEVIGLFRFLEWIMWLPTEQNRVYWQEVKAFEEAETMPYVMSIERISREEGWQEGLQVGLQQGIERGIEQGKQQGLHTAIELGVKLRFGTSEPSKTQALLKQIQSITNIAVLEQLVHALETAKSLDDIQRLCQQHLPSDDTTTPSA